MPPFLTSSRFEQADCLVLFFVYCRAFIIVNFRYYHFILFPLCVDIDNENSLPYLMNRPNLQSWGSRTLSLFLLVINFTSPTWISFFIMVLCLSLLPLLYSRHYHSVRTSSDSTESQSFSLTQTTVNREAAGDEATKREASYLFKKRTSVKMLYQTE